MAISCQSLFTRSMNVPDEPTAACAVTAICRRSPCLAVRAIVPVPRQMMTSATTANVDEMPRTAALATADAGGWCCDVQRIPTADSARTMPVKAVIARRMAFWAVIVNGSVCVTWASAGSGGPASAVDRRKSRPTGQ